MAIVKFKGAVYDTSGAVWAEFLVHAVPVQHIEAVMSFLSEHDLLGVQMWDVIEGKVYGTTMAQCEPGRDPMQWAAELQMALNEALGEV